MYYGSDEFNNAIENTQGNALKTRLKFSDEEIIELVSSMRYYGGSNDTDDLAIGNIAMAYVEVSAFTNKMLTGREFLLESGVKLSDGTYEYAPIGYFTVQTPNGDYDEVSFTAYDRMIKFEKVYSSSLTYPTDSAKVLDEICTMCGVELATPITDPITITENLKGYTCREVLSYIAGIHGFFACIDRFGELNLRWYSDTTIEKSLKTVWVFEKSQEQYEVEKVEVAKDSETSFTSGNGIITLHHSNPYATQEITNSLYSKLGGYAYMPAEVEMLDDVRLDPWDVISVTYYNGIAYLIPCMSIVHDFGATSTTIRAVGKTSTENEYRFTGPTIQYLNRMATDLLVANRVIATKVDAEYVQAHAITVDSLDVIEASIKSAVIKEVQADFASIDYLEANYADIQLANVEKADIGTLLASIGLIDRATIVDGHITGFLDAVEINANKITAGTLIADRILLSGGEEGVLYALNNLGELTSTNVDTLDGYVLTDRTINADKLIANSITANELDVNQIFGNEAVLNKIVSQEIFSDAVATNRVVVGKANRDEVVADNLLEFPYFEKNHTQKDIEWTVLDDATVKANGTASALSQFYFNSDTTLDLKPNTTYTLSGCPSGGSTSTYRMRIIINYRLDGQVQYSDIGNGVTFTTPSNYQHCRIMVDIVSGVTVNNLIFKPMLENGDVAHEYTEYAKGGIGIANNLYYSGTTQIDGGNIYANTITADKINVADLFAQDILATGSITGVTLNGVKGFIGNWEIADDGLRYEDGVFSVEISPPTADNGNIALGFSTYDEGLESYVTEGYVGYNGRGYPYIYMYEYMGNFLDVQQIDATTVTANFIQTKSGADLDTINSNLKWKELTMNNSGKSYTTLPTSAREINVTIVVANASGAYYFHRLPLTYGQGYYHPYCFYDGISKATVLVNYGTIILSSASIDGGDVTSTSSIRVVYR